jgi:hypothetical protein
MRFVPRKKLTEHAIDPTQSKCSGAGGGLAAAQALSADRETGAQHLHGSA